MAGRLPVAVPPLAALMDQLGLRVADVSAVSGVGRKVITALRSGRYADCTIQRLVAVASAVGCAPSDLVPGLSSPVVERAIRGQEPNALIRRVLARRAREQGKRQVASQLAQRETAQAQAKTAREALTAPADDPS